jgi:pimeloyl-ACP methyl ester carboxylesterase
VTLEVCVAGNRKIAVDISGSPTGTPVFLLHGTPGSRSGPRPRSSVLYRLGIRLVSHDRPGYGGSDPCRGRTVADVAADVEAIADELELPSFGVVGRSGGGPHALACAALLGHRVQSVACLVGLAPSDAADLDWYAGMADSNSEEFEAASNQSELAAAWDEIKERLAERAELIRHDPEEMLELLTPELADPDKRVVQDIAIRRLLTDTYREAVSKGSDGWIDDVVALGQPWGFDVATIKVPVLLWHGANDVFSPVGHTRWLARQMPTSFLAVQDDAAHFGAIEVLPNVLAWIKDPDCSEGLGIEDADQPALLP